MEILFGLFGLAIVIGGIAGFISLFTKQSSTDIQYRLQKFEDELSALKHRIHTLEKTRPDTSVKPVAPAEPVSQGLQMPEVQSHVPVHTTKPDDALHMADEVNRVEDVQVQPPVFEAENPAPKRQVYVPTPPPPYEPNFIEKGLAVAKDWLFGGNTLVRSGIVILFIGISFLIKYAAEHTHVPIELRLTGIALAGVALLVTGWRLREKRPQYSWALQGGGVGVLYLTIFAAYKMYQLMPGSLAFGLLVAVAFLSAWIAVMQSAMPLAILGFSGGFLAPILTSSGSGNHVGLFSYYVVLNLAIAFIAFRQSWRPLNVLGFAFTFIIGTLWGVSSYTPAHFATTEPFLIAHFLIYTAIVVLYAFRQATKVSDYVDATLVFGTPIVGFSLQYALLRDSHFGLAYSALALGIFYIALAWWVFTRKSETMQFLGECFLALGVGFATLALPLALDGRWISAAWAVEGVGLLWVGLRQQRTLPVLSGLVLQALAAIAFAKGWGLTGYSGVGHQNMFLGVAFIALSGWACGALLNTNQSNRFSWFATPLAYWGWAWWVGAGLTAVDAYLPFSQFVHAGLLFVALTSALLPTISRQLKWPQLSRLTALLLPAMAIALLIDALDNTHPFAHYGYVAWPVAIGIYMWLLAKDAVPQHIWLRAPLLWLVALIGVLEWKYQLRLYVAESYVWREIGWAVVPALLVGGVTRWQFANKNNLNEMQLNRAHTWGWVASLPLMVFLLLWFMWMSLNSSGNAAPLPYLPLLNPLDIALAAVLLLGLLWQRAVSQHLGQLRHINPALAGVMAFTLLNGTLLRTLHHWVGTPFQWTSIFNNSTVQVAFTFLWGIAAFGLMLLAHKTARRSVWIVGAGLMGLVVAKIFLLDMAQTGSVQRIASFIGAGLMLLVMGYFAPLPPADEQAKESA